MAKREVSDLYECREKIEQLLKEYNCELRDEDGDSWVLLYDSDTEEGMWLSQ